MNAQKSIKISSLPRFDAAEHLQDEGDIAAYLTVVLEENNPGALAHWRTGSGAGHDCQSARHE
ncbi:DNA-binding protein [Ottowia caeni]|uniref:helix-turn-helix domain-containing transcriptional regulator n=1 Tax=Ottowia caeni TaxID=2870339 RepID=UPI001E2DC9A7|nr:hypothetical protein [Ottowia caeni]